MRHSRGIAALAVFLALLAVGGRVIASGYHHHPDGDRDGHTSCAVCDAVHTVGTLAEPPADAPAPGGAWWPLVEGRTLDAVIFGITASNSRGPPGAPGSA